MSEIINSSMKGMNVPSVTSELLILANEYLNNKLEESAANIVEEQ